MIVFGSDGVEAVTVLLDDSQFSPLLGEANNLEVSPIWRMMPSEFGLLSRRDQKVMEAIWKGLLKSFATEMADSAFLDMTKSLLQFPVFRQRKWLDIEVRKTYELSSIPNEFTVSSQVETERLPVGMEVRFTGSVKPGSISCNLRAVHSREVSGRVEVSLLSVPKTDHPSHNAIAIGLFRDRDISAALIFGTDNSVGMLIDGTYWNLTAASYPCTWVLEVDRYGDDECVRATSGEFSRYVPIPSPIEFDRLEITPVTNAEKSSWAYEIPEDPPYVSWNESAAVRIQLASITLDDFGLWDKTESIPALFPRISDNAGLLRAQSDFRIVREYDPPCLAMFEPPSQRRYWAESVALAQNWLKSKYGQMTGIPQYLADRDSERSRDIITGLLYGLVSGPTVHALSLAVSALTGAAFAVEPGRVTALHSATGGPGVQVLGPYGVRNYEHDSELEPIVAVGDLVSQWDFLTDHVEMHDWVRSPEKIDASILRLYSSGTYLPQHEAAKYGKVLVEIPMSGTVLSDYSKTKEAILSYMTKALPVWVSVTRVFLRVVKRVDDRLNILDDTRMVGFSRYSTYDDISRPSYTRLSIREGLTDYPGMMYGDGTGIYSADQTYRYGDEHHFRVPDPVSLTFAQSGETTLQFLVNDVEIELEPDGVETYTTPIPQYEYPVIVDVSNPGESELSFIIDGVTFVVAPDTVETITTWTSVYSGTITLTVYNPSTDPASFVLSGDEYTVPPGESVDVSIEIPPLSNPE